MKIYYSLHRQCRIDQDGVPVIGAVLLRYKERPTWTIQLRDENNQPVDVSGVTGWRAAVDRDYDSGTAPMCRTLNDAIDSSAAASGSIAVSLDTNTVTFLAAVDGQDAAVAANFELWGFRDDLPVVYLVFPVSARAVVDAEGGVAPEEVQLRYDLDDIVRRLAALENSSGATSVNGVPEDASGSITIGAADIQTSRYESVDNELLSKVSSINGCFPDGNGAVWLPGNAIPVNGQGLEDALNEKVSSINGVYPTTMGSLDLWATHIYMNGERTDMVYEAIVALEESLGDIGSVLDAINGEDI